MKGNVAPEIEPLFYFDIDDGTSLMKLHWGLIKDFKITFLSFYSNWMKNELTYSIGSYAFRFLNNISYYT